MQSAKKILICAHAYFPHFVGGAEVAVREITNRIAPDDIEFHLLTLRTIESSYEQIGNIHIHRVSVLGIRAQRGILHTLAKLLFIPWGIISGIRLHRKYQFDSFWSLMASYGGFVALGLKKLYPDTSLLLSLQEGDSFAHIMRRVGVFRPIYRALFRTANRVQVISHMLGEYARDMRYTGVVTVIPNGVAVSQFANTTNQAIRDSIRQRYAGTDETLLITTSRLVEKNGIEYVIRALPALPRAQFLVIGSGILREYLEGLAQQLGVTNQVHFLGYIPYEQLPQYLHSSDIFIRPSLSEGLGNSFLEAMAAGIPVIATPVGGIVDFLIDGQTGVFCEVRDPQSIAVQINRIVTNPQLRAHITQAAYDMVVSRYQWDRVANDMFQWLYGV